MEPALHPSVEPLAFLLGAWKGEGDGVWPGADPFHYDEELTFEHVGDEFLMYSQGSWAAEDEMREISLTAHVTAELRRF